MKIPVNIFIKQLPDRFPENSQGDFYVENEVCTTCGAPEVEAPDLIEHSKAEYGHCYFKKQPKTADELERTISAMQVSCISGLRYGGKDEQILKRLYEVGLAEECDHKPSDKYNTIFRNKVQFHYDRSFREFTDELISILLAGQTSLNKQILSFNANDIDYLKFIYRWTDGLTTGIIFECTLIENELFQIEMTTEKDTPSMALSNLSSDLHVIFVKSDSFKDIRWSDIEGNKYDESATL